MSEFLAALLAFPTVAFFPCAGTPEYDYARDFLTNAIGGDPRPLPRLLFANAPRRRVISASGPRDELWGAAKEILKLRDRGEEAAPFIVDTVQPLEGLMSSGAIGLQLSWQPGGATAEVPRAVAALCAAHPGPVPVLLAWSDPSNGGGRFRSRSLRVDAADDLLVALRELLGPDHVHLVRAG